MLLKRSSKLNTIIKSPHNVSVSIHEYRGNEEVNVRILNEQELWIGVGKELPMSSPNEKASHLFRLNVLESLKTEIN